MFCDSLYNKIVLNIVHLFRNIIFIYVIGNSDIIINLFVNISMFSKMLINVFSINNVCNIFTLYLPSNGNTAFRVTFKMESIFMLIQNKQ